LIVGWDAFNLVVPDIFVDTMGYAFTVAMSHFLFPDVPTGAYVHYPTISTDMLGSLDAASGRGVNAGSGSGWKGKAKKAYWHLFARLYSWIGGSIDVVMTNSTWTQNHIKALWASTRQKRSYTRDTFVVFPPVAVEELEQEIEVSEESEKSRRKDILYIAQFRPEKDHQNIIMAFAEFLHRRKTGEKDSPRLVLVGSVRDEKDKMLVYKLRVLAREQHIADHVDFVIDAKWSQILDRLRSSWIGVNGMWNEHFGIGVVEYQAAGLISVVDDSGGPKYDIVVPIDGKPTGKSTLLHLNHFHWLLTDSKQVSTQNHPQSSQMALPKHWTKRHQRRWLCVKGPERAPNASLKGSSVIAGMHRWID
jgi:alpha-1,2-mannosyltransferase